MNFLLGKETIPFYHIHTHKTNAEKIDDFFWKTLKKGKLSLFICLLPPQ